MDSSALPILSQVSDSEDEIGSSDPETMNPNVVLEPDKIQELKRFVPGMWRFPTNPNLCCIYRVPDCLRKVRPKAYTPELVVIGPLHHCLKSQALKSLGDITNTKAMGYINMEVHKKIYLAKFAERFEGKNVVDGFKRIIEEDEAIIRASYSESTAWIDSPEFVEMILHDSVFIIELMLRVSAAVSVPVPDKVGDPLMDEPCLEVTIKRDLMLLENQLPYFLLEKLFDPIVPILCPNKTLRGLVIHHFRLEREWNKIEDSTKFRHFTDLYRCVRVDEQEDHGIASGDCMQADCMEQMHNAYKLYGGGVNFKVHGEERFSVKVNFKNGCLEIPCFVADDEVEVTLRNIMALEQCHYPFQAYVCSYVMLLDFLVDTDKDVDLLVEKGIIKNWIGRQGLVAKLVNKLCLGVLDDAYYSKLVRDVNARYNNPFYYSFGVLRRVYFSNLWKGTATVAATCILLMTLIQTVTSLIEITKDN